MKSRVRTLLCWLFLLGALASLPACETVTGINGIAAPPAPKLPDGSVSPAVTNGTSTIDIVREDPGYPYASFRACVIDTGQPMSDQRVFLLTNRGDQTVSTEVSILSAVDRNWSVHTLRRATLDPGDSFSVYVTFLPKSEGMHEIVLQVTSRRGSNVVEAISITLKGKGFDCREQEIPPEEMPPPPGEEAPDLLDPEEEDDGDDGGSGTGSTTTGGGTTVPPGGVVIRPEDLIPREQLLECPGAYTEAVSGWDYSTPPRPIRRIQPATLNTIAARYTNLPTLRATLNYIQVPSVATNPGPTQSIRWSDTQVRDEIHRAIRWYAKYCILLTFRKLDLRPNDATRTAQKYDAWLRTLPANLSMGLSDAASREGDNVLGSVVKAAKKVIPNRREVTVLFMDRVVGYVGRRLTQASFVPTGKNFLGVALHGADRDDPYILSHELIHAFGLGNTVTWYHNSGDARSMSRITRRSINDAAGLSGSRFLDFAEYHVIKEAGVVR